MEIIVGLACVATCTTIGGIIAVGGHALCTTIIWLFRNKLPNV